MPMLNMPTQNAQVISLTEESLARKQGIRFDSIHVNAQKEINFEQKNKNQEGKKLSFKKKLKIYHFIREKVKALRYNTFNKNI